MIIRKAALQVALSATSSDDTRYYLSSVLCEPDANRVIATNGHVLLIATDNYPMPDSDFPLVPGAEFHGNPTTPILVSGAIVKSMIATMPKSQRHMPILGCVQLSQNGSPTTATMATTDLTAPRVATIVKEEHANFPAYAKILEIKGPTVNLGLGVPVLEALIKAAKAAGSTTIMLAIPSDQPDVLSAFGVSMKGADVTVTGVAMPCRV